MKKLNRIISVLLTFVMLIGTISTLGIVGVGAEPADNIPDLNPNLNKEEIDALCKSLYTTVYATPQDKLATMICRYDNGKYQIWAHQYTGEVAIVNLVTGQIMFTNPYDIGDPEAASSNTVRDEILSQIVVKFLNNNTEQTFYSFSQAAMNGQIKVKNIKNGIRVEYSIGREETKYLVPRMITKERFETQIQENVRAGIYDTYQGVYAQVKYGEFMSFYTLRDPDALSSEEAKNQIYLQYPITKSVGAIYLLDESVNDSDAEKLKIEGYIKTYCPNYTYEEMEADHATTQYVSEEKNPPLFKMALEYTLDDWGVSVTLPANGIRFDEELYTLQDITVLPYMGAGSNPNTGYTFFPDGSGAIFRFEDLADANYYTVSGQIYGQDYAYHTIRGTNQEVIRYPVYGIVEDEKCQRYEKVCVKEAVIDHITGQEKEPAVYEDQLVDAVESRGFVAIIEEGESLAQLTTYHGANSICKYNTIKVSVNPRPSDEYNLADAISVGESATWRVVSSRKYVDDYKIRYIMLTDDKVAEDSGISDYYECSWLGMAKAYRDYLISQEALMPLNEEELQEDIPLYIETFGAFETLEKVLSVPVNVMTPLTTFDDIKTMYEDLSQESVGIRNINFKLTGYANGGLNSTVPYGLKWEKNVGGKNGFNELLDYAKEQSAKEGYNLELFPDFDFAYINNTSSFDGVSLKDHAVKTIDNRYSSKRIYSATAQTYTSYFQLALSPAYFSRFYTKLTENYYKFSKAGDGSDLNISVSTLGANINSDFDEDEPYNREDSKAFTKDAFKYLEDNYGKVMTDCGNAFAWEYLDYILNMPLDSSRYIKSSNAVPFMGTVLHGYIQYAGTPINMEGDIQYAFLKAIENGASIYFTLSYQNTTKLKEDELLSQYYSVRYDIWAGDYNDDGEFEAGQLVDIYHKLNDVMADLQTKIIIGHEFLDGTRQPDPDEAEADAKAEEEKKNREEAEKAAAEEKAYWDRINNGRMYVLQKAKTAAIDGAQMVADARAYLEGDYTLLYFKPYQEAVDNRASAAEQSTLRIEAGNAIAPIRDAKVNAAKNLEEMKTAIADAKIAYEYYSTAEGYADEFVNKLSADITEAEGLLAAAEEVVTKANQVYEDLKDLVYEYKDLRKIVNEAEDIVPPPPPVEPEKDTYNKYAVEDGSIVAVTYGDAEGNAYKTILLNYNYFTVFVEYEGETYTIEPYDCTVIMCES